MRVRGIDGCKGGWVAIDLVDGRFDAARFAASFEALRTDAMVIGVDIPIGLVDGPRSADAAARTALKGRASSIFNAPVRAALGKSFDEANRVTRSLCDGVGLSRQSHGLFAKVAEVDAHRGDRRLHEVHPELAFQAMAGERLANGKKSWGGQLQRRSLLERASIVLPADLGADLNAVPPDDILDAAACAWTAHRIGRGEAHRHTGTPEQHDGDRRIAIWT